MVRLFSILSVLLLSALSSSLAWGGDATPFASVRFPVPPEIDGVLDDACWGRTSIATGFIRYQSESPCQYHTEVRIGYDFDNIYIAAICSFPVEDELMAVIDEHDGEVWNDDSIEFFFCNDLEAPTHYQIVVNSLGAVYDSVVVNAVKSKDWNSNAAVAVSSGPGVWVLEAAIAWSAFGQDAGPEQQWSFNVTREHNIAGKNRVLSTWTPMPTGFHVPQNYIPCTFVDNPVTHGNRLISNSNYYQLLENGDFERSLFAWFGDYQAATLDRDAYSGLAALRLSNADPDKAVAINTQVNMQPNTNYRFECFLKYAGVEIPDISCITIVLKDSAGNIVSEIDAPGIGNMGGAQRDWHEFSFQFQSTAEISSADVLLALENTGTIWFDRIVLMRYEDNGPHRPELLTPQANEAVHGVLTFSWRLFEHGQDLPGTYTVMYSQDEQFNDDSTVVVNEAWGRYIPNAALENGLWYWRVRFDGEIESVWSDVGTFTVDINTANEALPPVVDIVSPQGWVSEQPSMVRVRYSDLQPGHVNTRSIRLLVNHDDVTESCQITDQELTYLLTASERQEALCHYELVVRDNNGNGQWTRWFSYFAQQRPEAVVDDAGFIVRNGQRFFPIASYAITYFGSYDRMAEAGFNCNYSPWGHTLAHLETAYRHGMTVAICNPGPMPTAIGYVDAESQLGQEMLTKSAQQTALLASHPATLGFYLGDESADHGVTADNLLHWRNQLRQIAPNQFTAWLPTYRRNAPHIWSNAAAACDMLIWHDYNVGRFEPLSSVVHTIDHVRSQSDDYPHLAIIEAFNYSDFGKPNRRHPSFDELSFQVYLSIVNKTRGICFYQAPIRRDFGTANPYAETDSPEFLDYLFRLAGELRDLHDVLVADDNDDAVTVTAPEGSRVDSIAKVIDEKIWLFVVNTSEQNVPARFVINGNDTTSVLDWRNQRSLPCENSQFSEDIPPYGVRVYKIDQ